MKRTPPTAKHPKTTSPAKPAAKSALKPKAAAKKAPAKKPIASKSPPRSQPTPAAPAAAASPATPATNKQSQLIALLCSSGATLAQMMALTGWQAHTVRGMLSGSLRKRLGLDVQSQVEEGLRVYRIVEGFAK